MGLKYRGPYPVRGRNWQHFFKCTCGQSLRTTKSNLDASSVCEICGHEWQPKDLRRSMWIAERLESVKGWYAEWFLNVGWLPWLFTVLTGIAFYFCWADLVTLQIEGNVPPDWRTARFALPYMVFLIYAGIVFGICRVVDAGWNRKTISILALMLALACFYAGWYQSRDSLLGRLEETAFRHQRTLEFTKFEIKDRARDQEVVAHYQRLLPLLRDCYDSAIAAYLEKLDAPETSLNYSPYWWATGGILLVLALFSAGAMLYTSQKPVIEAAREVQHSGHRSHLLASTFGKTVFVSFTFYVGLGVVVFCLAFVGSALFIIGALIWHLIKALIS